MKIAISVSVLALLGAGTPAEAGQARAVLSVTAVVTPTCSVDRDAGAPHRAQVACSTGASVSTMTAASHDEQPLAEAEILLGGPVRRGRGIAFTGPVSPASSATTEAQTGARYLTVTY